MENFPIGWYFGALNCAFTQSQSKPSLVFIFNIRSLVNKSCTSCTKLNFHNNYKSSCICKQLATYNLIFTFKNSFKITPWTIETWFHLVWDWFQLQWVKISEWLICQIHACALNCQHTDSCHLDRTRTCAAWHVH
jgi:hypothetical protein